MQRYGTNRTTTISRRARLLAWCLFAATVAGALSLDLWSKHVVFQLLKGYDVVVVRSEAGQVRIRQTLPPEVLVVVENRLEFEVTYNLGTLAGWSSSYTWTISTQLLALLLIVAYSLRKRTCELRTPARTPSVAFVLSVALLVSGSTGDLYDLIVFRATRDFIKVFFVDDAGQALVWPNFSVGDLSSWIGFAGLALTVFSRRVGGWLLSIPRTFVRRKERAGTIQDSVADTTQLSAAVGRRRGATRICVIASVYYYFFFFPPILLINSDIFVNRGGGSTLPSRLFFEAAGLATLLLGAALAMRTGRRRGLLAICALTVASLAVLALTRQELLLVPSSLREAQPASILSPIVATGALAAILVGLKAMGSVRTSIKMLPDRVPINDALYHPSPTSWLASPWKSVWAGKTELSLALFLGLFCTLFCFMALFTGSVFLIVQVLVVAGFAPTLLKRARRLAAVVAQGSVSETRPVLLLRSFENDHFTVSNRVFGLIPQENEMTLEEVVVRRLGRLGPVVAIGRPGEAIPPLGAAREYVAHDEWQERVRALLSNARLIVVIVGFTEGVAWEIRQIIEMDLRDRVILVLPPFSRAELEKDLGSLEAPGIDLNDLRQAALADAVTATVSKKGELLVVTDRARDDLAYDSALRVSQGFLPNREQGVNEHEP